MAAAPIRGSNRSIRMPCRRPAFSGFRATGSCRAGRAHSPRRALRRGPRRRAAAPSVRTVDPAFLPALVDYPTGEQPGTIVIDTRSRYLYLVLADGKAQRYGVGVGREGFGWSGR